MPRPTLHTWRTALVVVALVLIAPGGARAFAANGASSALLRAAGAAEVQDVYVRPPQTVPAGERLQVLIALHGMGGNGATFGGSLASLADEYGWLIVAPTLTYGDWTDPEQVGLKDPALVAWLSDYVRHLGERTGYAVEPRVLLFGHSRGAQLALRFTEIHPEEVLGVAAASAGTYTLPAATDQQTGQPLEFPFGVVNLAQADGGRPFDAYTFQSVPIWIGVGANDNNAADVPDAWDPYLGDNRLQRATTFTSALQSMGADVSMVVFPNTEHGLTDAVRQRGCEALAEAESNQTLFSARAT